MTAVKVAKATPNVKPCWFDPCLYSDSEDLTGAICTRLACEEDELVWLEAVGFPECWLDEEDGLNDEVWEFLDLSEDDQLAFGVYMEDFAGKSCATVDGFREAYVGIFDSGAQFAEEQLGEYTVGLPNFIKIDWEDTWHQDYDHICGLDTQGNLHFFRNI